MSFWSRLNPFSRTVKATAYDVERDTDASKGHWSNAKAATVAQVTRLGTRRTLRDRARYEVRNNSYASGVGHTLANFTIGTGPRPQVLGHEAHSQIEEDFRAWAANDGLAEKLRLMRFARYESGEGFLLRGSRSIDEDSATEVSLTLLPVECDRFTDSAGGGSLDGSDGIKFDRYGEPVSYAVRDELGWKHEEIPAEFVIHYFRQDRPGQRRGIPEITPALPLFAQMRQYTIAVITCAESAARPGGVMQSNSLPGEEDTDEEPESYDTFELPNGSMMVLPKGYTYGQVKPEQPTTTYSEFKREILSEAGRCLNVPANVMLGDSSQYNFASGRLDHQTFFVSIGVEQWHIVRVILERIFAWWWQEYRVLKGFSGPAPQVRWYWDAVPHVDPAKEANAQGTRLANGTTTLAAEFAADGLDWEEQLRQRAIEAKRIKELETEYGIALSPVVAIAVSPEKQSVKNDDTEDEDPEEKDEPAATKPGPNRKSAGKNPGQST